MKFSYRVPLLLGLLMALAFVFMAPNEAEAIPAFARKYKVPCSTCHAAWPLLNKTGRNFKENGFRMSRKEKPKTMISDFLQFDENLPLSAVIVARPYDESSGSGTRKIRAIHEVELLGAGVPAQDFSLFFEFEAEDETGFDPEVGAAFVGYHPVDYFNAVLAWGSMFTTEPYDTIGTRRLTRGRNSVIDQRLGGADSNGRLRDNRQNILVYGRPIKEVYYGVGFSGIASDSEGEEAEVLHGRLAVDVIPELTLGAFAVDGKCHTTAANCASERDFTRYGFDAQAEYMNATLHAAYMTAEDDQEDGTDHENDVWYVEGLYAITRDMRPWIVPLLRYDSWEQNDGADSFESVVFNLSYYLRENVKFFLELFGELDVPAGQDEENRITVQAELAF